MAPCDWCDAIVVPPSPRLMELVHYVGECVAPCDWCDAIVVPPSPRLMELVHYVGECVAHVTGVMLYGPPSKTSVCGPMSLVYSGAPMPKTNGIGASVLGMVAPCDWCDAISGAPIPKTNGIGALCWRVCGPM